MYIYIYLCVCVFVCVFVCVCVCVCMCVCVVKKTQCALPVIPIRQWPHCNLYTWAHDVRLNKLKTKKP